VSLGAWLVHCKFVLVNRNRMQESVREIYTRHTHYDLRCSIHLVAFSEMGCVGWKVRCESRTLDNAYQES
jgi:hypothetical protein